jgi:phage shock protein C
MKRLYRSKENKVVFGIFGGLGEYYGKDPVLFRLAYVLLAFATGLLPLLLAYFVATLVVPKPKAT